MPLIPIAVAFLMMIALVLAIPFGILQRYRAGTARRVARRWVAVVNLSTMLLSAALFLWAAAITNYWVRDAFRYSIAGLLAGCLLGFLGLALTRWEPGARVLHYTPNRWLVLLITTAVALRLLYSLWRGWQVWQTADSTAVAWSDALGVARSMAVGASVLGYYLMFWAGLLRRIKRHSLLR